ncbi:MAG: DUF2007 domain-containing protein [Chloroflexi bacterium]|nr:DUF2007 domain-containing protein [Chloroflexota bacterium]
MTHSSDSNARPDDLMVVFTTNNSGEAHIVAGRLQSEDIPTAIAQEPAGSALGIQIGLLGDIKILVRAADYERAAAILAEDAEPPYLPEDADQIIFEDSPDHEE